MIQGNGLRCFRAPLFPLPAANLPRRAAIRAETALPAQAFHRCRSLGRWAQAATGQLIMCCGLKPSRTLNKSQKLRSRRPAATINTKDSATHDHEHTTRSRLFRGAFRTLPFLPERTSDSPGFVRQAGVRTEIAPAKTGGEAKSITVQLIDMSLSRGRLCGIICSRNPLVANRTAKPAIPPSRERSRLSVNNYRTSCCARSRGLGERPSRVLSHLRLAPA